MGARGYLQSRLGLLRVALLGHIHSDVRNQISCRHVDPLFQRSSDLAGPLVDLQRLRSERPPTAWAGQESLGVPLGVCVLIVLLHDVADRFRLELA